MARGNLNRWRTGHGEIKRFEYCDTIVVFARESGVYPLMGIQLEKLQIGFVSDHSHDSRVIRFARDLLDLLGI